MRAIFAICVVACVLVASVAADKPASSSKIRKPTKAEAQKNLLDTNVDRFLNLGELDLLKDDAWEELMKDADSTAPKDKTAFKKLVRSSALKAIETYQALLLQIDKLNKANKDTVSFFGVGYDPADQSKPLAERRIGVFAGTTSESAKVTWTGLPDKIHRFSKATGPRVKRSEVGKMLRADPKAVNENKSRARNNDLIADKGKSRLPSRRAREDSISSARPVPAFAELRARRAKSKVRAFNPNLGPGHSVGVNTAPTFTCQHGTITLFVKGGGNVYMLTNQHVAGNGQTACYNNPTTVAGAVPASASANIGPVSHDSNHFIVDAFLDSSLTQLSAADATYGTSWTCNTPSGTALTSTTRIPHLLSGLNMLVQRNVRKEGRTTGVTDGQIRYFGWLLFENVFHLTTHSTAGQYVITQAAPGAPFSRPGDSGSPIWTPNSGNVCAQLWGGWQYPIFNDFTYANPIHKVLWWARAATLSNIQLDCN